MLQTDHDLSPVIIRENYVKQILKINLNKILDNLKKLFFM